MKRLFTFAIIAMVASLTFAQVPVTQKAAPKSKIEKVQNLGKLQEKANKTKAFEAAKAEKAQAPQTTSTSVFRKSGKNVAASHQALTNKAISGVSLNAAKASAAKKVGVGPKHATEQVGNLTVTTDDHGIITDVTGVEAKYYARSSSGTAYYYYNSSVGIAEQSGMVEVMEDGDYVYVKNPINRYTQNSWVKGVKSGNTISFATYQPLAYSDQYDATLSIHWGMITLAGGIVEYEDAPAEYTFTVEGDTWMLNGTLGYDGTEDAPFIGVYWDDDNTFTGYGDAATVLTYQAGYEPPTTDLVVLPEGVATENWYLNGQRSASSTTSSVKNENVKVAFDGDDVYIAGLCTEFPESWVKGTISGTDVNFSNFQYVGDYSDYNIWIIGYDEETESMVAPAATYDSEAKTIAFTNSVISNASADRVYYLEWLEEAVVSAEEVEYVEPIITEETSTLPYVNTFETIAEQDEVGIYDANEDGSTFSFQKEGSDSNIAARYSYNSTNDADDYLVFPGLPLEAGKTYKVMINARAQSSWYPERMEVLAGTVAKASAFTIPVIPSTELTEAEYETLKNAEFSVEADGTYFFAVHATSDANMFYLYVDDFSVSEVDPEAPVAVADLVVTPDAAGANSATVTFTMPAATVGENVLTGDLSYTIKCAGQVAASGNAAAGSLVEEVVNVDAPGFYTFSVVVADGSHVSDMVSSNVYVGEDVPGPVENIVVADKSESILVAWSAPTTTENGGVLIPEHLTYNVYPVVMEEFWGFLFPSTDFENPYATGLSVTEAEVPFDTNTGEMGYTYVAVAAENEAGLGYDTFGAFVTGTPFSLPVEETFAGGQLNSWVGVSCDPNSNDYYNAFFGTDPEGGDCVVLSDEIEGWVQLETGKVALNGAVNPVVSVSAAANVENAKLELIVLNSEGQHALGTFDLSSEFAQNTVSLLPYANDTWVRVFMKAQFPGEGEVYINRVKVYNQLDNNLRAADITAPKRANAGDDVPVVVKVENVGSNQVAANDYHVVLYVNGEEALTAEGVELAADAVADFTFEVPTNTLFPETLTFKAKVVYPNDEDPSDSETAEVSTALKLPKYPVVEDLAGEAADGNVTLTWSEPSLEGGAAEEVTDSFEEYDSFAINEAGDWTFVDVDQSDTYGFSGLVFPGATQPMAYIVFDGADDEFVGYDGFQANSGDKYMASFAATSGANDDWMISPELTGDAQTVTFYAKTYTDEYGSEEFEFLYSSTNTAIESFTKLGEDHNVPTEWTEYSYNLPAGAKYFAIRCVSQDRFIFLVDDVTYTPAGATSADLSILGYNVYCDNVKVNESPVGETKYVDQNVEPGKYTYAVTVVYNLGESASSNEVEVEVEESGIANAKTAGVSIYTGAQSIVIANAEGRNITIAAADGAVVYNNKGALKTTVNVASGVYVVTVGKDVKKVIVK